MHKRNVLGQRDFGQHALKLTALAVPSSGPHLCFRHWGRRRSWHRQSQQWLGQWRGVGRQSEDAEGEAAHWAGLPLQRADVLLSLHIGSVSNWQEQWGCEE